MDEDCPLAAVKIHEMAWMSIPAEESVRDCRVSSAQGTDPSVILKLRGPLFRLLSFAMHSFRFVGAG